MTRSALSVVIPTRDRVERLRRCVASLRAALRDVDELIVVDSASRDALSIQAIARSGGALYLRAQHPGVNRARNLGWQRAANGLIAFVDDDVVVEPTWADAFAASAVAHPDAAFITGRLSPLGDSGHGPVAVKDDSAPATLTRLSRGDLGHGASVLVRAAALAAVGGWDESLGAGAKFESAPEADLFDRLLLAGFEGRYEPAARARHEQWRTPRQLVGLDWRYGFGNGARLAKLVRTDRPRARWVASEAAWGWGLQRLGAPVRARNKTETARVLARLAGTGAGFGAALLTPVREGHFVNRAKSDELR
ncbi:MAG TPA: glycosyltransferase [Acidimicrobiales bacterium]|nr:glycosyltransferase [Acidimicrobiales bacterium]